MIEFDGYGEEPMERGREMEGEVTVMCRGNEVEGRAM